jgi:integrase
MIAPVSTLSGFLEETYLVERFITDGAAEQLRVAVRTFCRFLGRDPSLAELCKTDLLGWLKEMVNTRSPSTINSKRQAILSVWRAAAAVGLSSDPPRIPRMVEPQILPVAWTLADLNRLLGYCGTLRGDWQGLPVSLAWRILLMVLWDTGARINTMLLARVADIDLARCSLFVPARNLKGRKADRVFQLHPQTVALVQESMAWPRGRLFPWPYSRRHLWTAFGRLLKAAGLPCDRRHKFHCIRRTSESYAAEARGIEWAASAVGHSVQVARRYISPLIYHGPSLVEALPRPTFR